jgi:hypothetical protein
MVDKVHAAGATSRCTNWLSTCGVNAGIRGQKKEVIMGPMPVRVQQEVFGQTHKEQLRALRICALDGTFFLLGGWSCGV